MTSKSQQKAAYVCNAISGDFEFLQLLENGSFQGKVHSIFDRTVNVSCLENGELYTIAARTLDNGPNTLITDLDRCSTLELAVGDRIFVSNKYIKVENKLNVSIKKTKLWHCLLPAYPTDTALLRHKIDETKKYIQKYGKSGGMKKSLTTDNIIQTELERMLAVRSQSLLEQLSLGRWESAVQRAVQLIGLGPGLTPSGDDYLTGLFAVLNMPGSPLWPYRSFCMDVVLHSSELTNQISCITMKKAAAGQVRESIVQFLQSAAHGTSEETNESLAAVLSIGSSSGTDIALGLIHGLELNLN